MVAGKSMSGKKKILVFLALAVCVAGLVMGIRFYVTYRNYKNDVAAIQVQNVDLTSIPDGDYFGDCNVDFVAAKVRVTVRNHALARVELLEHDNGRGTAAEVLPGKMVAEQRVDVDAVTGATSSSRVIQEAVYNALTGKRTIRGER